MNVISNTTVLSNFAAIESLHRLHELFEEVFLPTEVLPSQALSVAWSSGSSATSGLWKSRMAGSRESLPLAFTHPSQTSQVW